MSVTQAFTDRKIAALKAAGQINVAFDASVITDAMVSANVSCAALKAAILSVGALRADTYPIAVKTGKAIDLLLTLSAQSEAHGFSNVSAFVANVADLSPATRRVGIWS